MTQSEYIKGYRIAHAKNGRLTLKTQRELQKVFQEAGKLASDVVKKTTAAGLSDLTSTAWEQINQQLQAGADLVSQATADLIPEQITAAYKNLLDVDTKYIMDAVNVAGVKEITRAGIQNMGVAVNFDLLNIQATRIYSNGYTFSDAVWSPLTTVSKVDGSLLPTSINGDYQYRIKNVILTGQAQGRDVIDIADDIDVYVKRGKKELLKPARYGKLKPGTGKYKRRISKRVDWRTLRLARSEMNNSLQEGGVLEGTLNPAAKDLYDWRKTPGNPLDQDTASTANGARCIDLDRASPYKKDDVPFYNHSNCSCQVVPVLINQRDFVNDLKKWTPGGEPQYLNDWYNEQYLTAQ